MVLPLGDTSSTPEDPQYNSSTAELPPDVILVIRFQQMNWGRGHTIRPYQEG